MKDILKNIFHSPGFRGSDRHAHPRIHHSVSPCERSDSPEIVAGSEKPPEKAEIPAGKVSTSATKPTHALSMLTPVMQEQLDLRLASAENPTVVMELDLDCNLIYVSKSWEQLVGTSVKKILHKPIANILIGSSDADLSVFNDAVAQMIADNASYKVKFVTATNDVEDASDMQLLPIEATELQKSPDHGEFSGRDAFIHDFTLTDPIAGTDLDSASTTSSKLSNNGDVIELEAQGVVILSPTTKLPTHTIWTVRPFVHLDLDLTIPSTLVDLLGFGAEILEGFLVSLRQSGIIDENFVPEPKSVLCRICETNFPAWFIEKHSDLCLLEHKVEEEVQFCHDSIAEQRELILHLSESLWLQQCDTGSGPATPSSSTSSLSSSSVFAPEYKGIPLTSVSGPDDHQAQRSSSLSTKKSASFPSFRQSRKFPFGILQKLVDFCDEALLINAAERSETTGAFEFSPNTQEAMRTVMDWPSLETSDPAMRAMVEDTKFLVTEKVENMSRLLDVLQYSEKIKQEVDELVLESVADTVAMIREKTRQQEVAAMVSRPQFSRNSRSSENASPSYLKDNWDSQNKKPSLPLSHDFSATVLHSSGPPTRPAQNIHSPQPSRVRSPSSRILGEEFQHAAELSRPLQSFTPQDLLTGSSDLLDSRVDSRASLSPNTSVANISLGGMTSSMEGLVLGFKSPEDTSLHSSISSPRLHLSPAPYVERPGLSALQRNTNVHCNRNSTTRPLSGDYSASPMKKSWNRARSSSNLSLPPSANPDLQTSTVPSMTNLSSTTPIPGARYSFSSIRPPISPLLVSQPTQKAATGGIKDYEILKAISKGAYGSVFLAKRRLTGDYVAIKCLKKGDMIAKNQVLNVRAERAVMMKQTDSPYVAQLHCSFQTKDYLFLVMEYLNGGDCATLLKMLGTLGDKWAKRYIAEVVVGVNDLHKRDIIHRDLKPDNLLIDSQGHLKLTDFGLSRIGVVGRHTFRHRKSSASEHGIELFRRSLTNNSIFQSPLVNSTAIESPELNPFTHKRHSSVTPFSLSPATDQHKFSLSHGHSASMSSYEATSVMSGAKKKSMSHFRASSNRSGSASSGMDSPLIKPSNVRSLSESSFALLDDECEFSVSPGQNEDSIHSFALFDPNQDPDNLKKFVGTPDYLAPETIMGDKQGEYSDWWSIGCILFEFLYGYPPFHAESPEAVFQNILSGEIDWPVLSAEEDMEFCTLEAKDLIKRLLTLDYEHRLGFHGAEEIMQHPYFKGVDWNSLYSETPDSFIPTLDGPDSTDYFDLRGADISHFPKDDPEYTAIEPLTKKRTDSNSDSGSPGAYLSMPSTPTHGKKERRGSKLADPSEFGSFNFRNLNVLEKANKDVINRLKSEHLEHRSSLSSSSSESFTPGHSKSRGSSISSNIVNLGSPFKRPLSPASITIGPSSPAKDKLPQRVNKKWDSATGSTVNSSRSRSSAPSLSRQILSRTANEQSPFSSDNEESTSALHRVQNRRDSLRRLNSSASGSSQGTQGTQSPQKDLASFVAQNELDVLYCEPIPIVRHTVSKIMEKQGCIVLPIADGEDLIRRATSKVKFDLIFTALRLTKIEAIDAVKLIKYTSGVNSNTPIIAVTGFAKEAIDSGIFDDVLEKPVDGTMIRNLMTKFHFSSVAIELEPEE